MNKNYNLASLQGFGETDENMAEAVETFPTELLHSPEINLWLTWFFHLTNLEKNDSRPEKLLLEQFQKMRLIIPHRYWSEIELSFNNPLSWEFNPEWYLDNEKLIKACKDCYEKNPHKYPGYIQDEDGFELTYKFQGRWTINPTDYFWSKDESIERYYYHYYDWRDKSGEELYENLVDVFGKINLPSWSFKIRNKGKG
jgi:hypothetical protein